MGTAQLARTTYSQAQLYAGETFHLLATRITPALGRMGKVGTVFALSRPRGARNLQT